VTPTVKRVLDPDMVWFQVRARQPVQDMPAELGPTASIDTAAALACETEKRP